MNTDETFAFRTTAMDGVMLVEASSDRSFVRHTHDQFGIGLMISGAQESLSGRGQLQACAGDLITVNPGEVHDGRPVGGSMRLWWMLYCDPEQVADIAAALDRPRGMELHHPVLMRPDVATNFAWLFAQLRDPGSAVGSVALETALLSIFAPLLNVRESEKVGSPAAVRDVKAAIDEEPENPLSLDEMSLLAGLGRYQFLRAFKRATGLPPCSYRLQRQLQLARRLILAGRPIAEAAAHAGFADQAHMTRHFARSYGVRPGALAVNQKSAGGASIS